MKFLGIITSVMELLPASLAMAQQVTPPSEGPHGNGQTSFTLNSK